VRDGGRAVALRYTEALPAPMVIASGRGRAAESIARIAREHGVTIVRDTELADALITVDLGSLIPEELYGAVAAVLAFVRTLEARR
jgi:flagellar biosynthesis protein